MHDDDWNRFSTYVQAVVASKMDGDYTQFKVMVEEFEKRGSMSYLEELALEIVTPLMDKAGETKSDEPPIIYPDTCIQKSLPEEKTFTLLGRDPVSPRAVRYWASERIRTGKNRNTDPEVIEADEIARIMEDQRDAIRGMLTDENRVSIQEMQLDPNNPTDFMQCP